MEQDLSARLDAIEKKLDETHKVAEKTRKLLMLIVVGSAVAFVLPLIGLLFAVPAFISTYSNIGNISM